MDTGIGLFIFQAIMLVMFGILSAVVLAMVLANLVATLITVVIYHFSQPSALKNDLAKGKTVINKLIDFLNSLEAFIRLSWNGFRITHSTNQFVDSEIYRFWWGERVITDMPDIYRMGDRFNTMLAGRSKELKSK